MSSRKTGSLRGLEDYALACRRVGQPVVQCEGTWWREVRSCFFRPILPFLDVPSGPAGLPFRSALGGCQYPSREGGHPPNSFLTYLVFTDARAYGLEHLNPRVRGYVRSAEKRFRIRPLSGGTECKARAHPAYLEFHKRTKYAYLDNRVSKPRFEQWVDAEFEDPGLVALGAWAGDSLVAVSLSRVVGEAWLYSTFFASDEALRGQVANLMLHHARCLAAAADGVTMVFAGTQKPGAGASVDEFYLRRGARLVQRPAVLRVNPLVRWVLSRFKPGLWGSMSGGSDAAGVIGTPGR